MKSGSEMLSSRKRGQIWLVSGLIVSAALCVVGKARADAAASDATSKTVVAPLILSGKSSTSESAQNSPVIAEIIRLLDAKVDASVLKGYIQNATMTYSPSAAELTTLQEHGAKPETLIALLQRGAEVMARAVKTESFGQPTVILPVHHRAPETYVEYLPTYTEPSYPTDYETVNESPVYYYAPLVYPGFGPAFPPGGRPPGRGEGGRRRPDGGFGTRPHPPSQGRSGGTSPGQLPSAGRPAASAPQLRGSPAAAAPSSGGSHPAARGAASGPGRSR